MVISRYHMQITLLIAILLHVGIAAWLSLPAPAPEPELKKMLRVSLLAKIVDTGINVVNKVVEPKTPDIAKPEPVIEKKPVQQPEKRVKAEKKPGSPDVKPVEKIKEAEHVQPAEIVRHSPQSAQVESDVIVLDAVAVARYEQLLVAWLEKHKKYPLRAKRLRIQGEGMLRIRINRAGETRQVSLVQRTGNRLLDKAALEMAKRANPFPPMPENDSREHMEFLVPVALLLR